LSVSNGLLSYKGFGLIVWDIQYGITSRTLKLEEILENTRQLIEASHEHKCPVVFSQGTGIPYEFQSAYSRFWLQKRGIDPKVPRMVEGSHDWEIMKEIKPTNGDLVIRKHFQSFFVGTPVEAFLRSRGVEVLVIAGVSTEVGVEATARHAAHLGFIPVIAEDAVGSSDNQLHQASLAVMRKLFEVRTTNEIVKNINQDYA